MHFTLKSATASSHIILPASCWQHDYIASKAMDIILCTYSLGYSSVSLDRYNTSNPVWSFWLESKMLWQLTFFLLLQQCCNENHGQWKRYQRHIADVSITLVISISASVYNSGSQPFHWRETNPDTYDFVREPHKIFLPQVNWHIFFYCINEVCYTK